MTTATSSTRTTDQPATKGDNKIDWQSMVPTGYTLTSWVRAHYALIKKTDLTVEGQPWLTVTEFGTQFWTDRGSKAEQAGRDRAQWCEQSAALIEAAKADKASKAAKAEQAKVDKAAAADKAKAEQPAPTKDKAEDKPEETPPAPKRKAKAPAA